MAKKSTEEKSLGPSPVPKTGDLVSYVFPPGTEPLKLGGQALSARVLAVYAGCDGRLTDLEIATDKGPLVVKSAPWRDDGAGNTWHWPED